MDLVRLSAGLATLGVAHDEEVCAKLLSFAGMLKKWGKVYNLTTLLGDEEILTHHLLDSAAFLPMLKRFAPEAKTVLDVGSGGGLPVIPLAILRADLRIEAVDAVAKKTAFLTQVGIELKLRNFRAHHARVERLVGGYDVISSRAFASLKDFTAWTSHLLNPGGRWLAMKGVRPEAEILELPAGIRLIDVVPLQVPGLSEERHLVVLGKEEVP